MTKLREVGWYLLWWGSLFVLALACAYWWLVRPVLDRIDVLIKMGRR